jgi:cobalt-zinc-cadmium resistance protein CzcA
MALLDFVLRQRLAVILLSIALAAVGIWAFGQLSIEAYPDISDFQTTVITLYPGHAPEEVEQQITIPIERALNNVPWVIARRSRTIFALSIVDLTYEWGTDEYLARQVVLEKLREVELPEGVTASLAPPTTPAGELYRYVLTGNGYDDIALRELNDWVVTPRLLQVPGVGDVYPFGGAVKQYQIQVDPLALYKYNLSVRQVADAVGANNENAGGSLLNAGQQALVVRGVGMIRSPADLENIVLTSEKGIPVFMRDVGRVQVGAAVRTGIFGLNERMGGVEGIAVMRRGENPSNVLAGIREAVEELRATGLPNGVRMETIYDRTELVNNTLHTVSRTLIEALLVIFLVLLLLLGSFTAAVLTAIVVPLSLLFAFACMHFAGVPASLLSLGALDFGIIIDGTLVMVASVVRLLADEPGDHDAATSANVLERIRAAASQVQRPIFFSLLILIAAYIPLFQLERVERRLFTPMAFTTCAALVGSLIFTLALVPAAATILFRRGCRPWQNPVVPWLIRMYESSLRFSLKKPWGIVAVNALIIVGAGVLAVRLGTEFLPQLDEGVVWIRANLPPGISLEKSAEVGAKIRGIVRQFPEVYLATTQTGRQDSNTEPFGPNRNELLVALKPYSTWPSGKRKADFIRELSQKLRAEIPGAAFNFTQPIMDMVTEAVTGSSADLAVIITGPDLPTLRKKAAETLAVLREIPGAADTAIEQEADQPQLRIHIDRNEAARHGINISDIQTTIELAIGGRPVSTMFEGDRRFDITVRYVPEARSSLQEIGNILVTTADGSRIPLERLAKIDIADGASIISRRENRRQISVRTNIRGRDEGGFAAEAQRAFHRNVQLPPGYRVEWGGQFENLDRARKRLAWILPITILVIFGLLYWAFASARDALLVLTAVPFSIVGGVIALWARGMPFSVSAAVGFVSLFGVAVMSGLLYVAEINRHRAEAEHHLEEAVIQAARAQLRPRLILIMVALLGMVPAAIARGIGSDIQRPLATVIVGGLISTLALTLPGLPVLYCLAERYRPRRHVRKAAV